MVLETEFTPLASLLGGVLVGISAVILMAGTGRISGVSGIVSRLLPPLGEPGALDRVAFLAGLLGAPLVYLFATGASITQTVSSNVVLLIIAGLLVGFGSVWGGGCTSGHGVCGVARMSTRSLLATLVFTGAGMVAVFVVRHVMGGL